MRFLTSTLLFVFFSLPAQMGALNLEVVIDLGPVADPFATRSIDLPELEGVAIIDEPVFLTIRFAPGTALESTVYPGTAVGVLDLFFDPLPSLSEVGGPRVDSFAIDQDGLPVADAGTGSVFRPGPPLLPNELGIGVSLDRGIAPSATFQYFGAVFQWDFDPRHEAADSVIRDARYRIIDTRRFAPPGEPLPHRVVAVPEPSPAWMGAAVLAVAWWRSGSRR